MSTAICSTASANASATTGFSAATLPHLLIAVLAAGVMVMGAGGLLLFGSGFSIAPQSHVSPLPVTLFTVTGLRWGRESWILRGASSPSRSLAGSALLTAVRSFPDMTVSQLPLPDHAELAAAEKAQREAARTRRSGRLISRRGRAWTSEPVGGFCASAPPGSLAGPAQFTAVCSSGKVWSRSLLPDHAELVAAEQAQREAALARRGRRPIRRALAVQTLHCSQLEVAAVLP